MLTTAPHLLVRRPSPTTAEFIVTTLPMPTLPLRILHLLLSLARILSSVAILLVLESRWARPPPTAIPLIRAPPPPPTVSFSFCYDLLLWALDAYQASPLHHALAALSAGPPLAALLPACLAALYVLSLRAHRTESLLVLRGLGVQTSESASTYLSTTATRFIPTEKIQDIFVNEAFRGFEVKYYLVVVVEGEESVVVVFPGLLPRRAIVESVWRGVRECLYEGKEDKT